MNRATPNKVYGAKVAAELDARERLQVYGAKIAAEVDARVGGTDSADPPTRLVPRLHEHKKLGQAYVEFRVGKRRSRFYFGPWGSQAALAKYRAWARAWPSWLTEGARPKGKWPAPRLLTYDGRTQRLTAWAKEKGLRAGTIAYRLDVLKWSVERALTTPKQQPTFAGRLSPARRVQNPQQENPR